jgi:aspergillopepsin I
MPSFTKIAAAAALVAGASAAPATKQTFSVEQVANPNYKGVSGIGALTYALQKFGASERATAVQAAAAVSSGSVTATPAQYDSEYLCPVTIGGSQTLTLDFDTGSSDLWVFSTLLPASDKGSHTEYSPVASEKLAGASWSISYGDGSGAAGVVYKASVDVGGATVTSQAVEAATSVSSEFVSDPGDGLLGLAFSSINTVKPTAQTTFFDTAIAQGLPAVFAADLVYHAAGSYQFGFTDSSKYTGSITYTPVDSSQGFWGFTPSGYAIGTAASVSASSTVMKGIADTGTTLLLADPTIVTAYYKQVKGASNSAADGGYIFPCSATLPDFSLVINGYKATVPGEYINYSPVSTGSSSCFGGIQSDTGIGFAIYGDIFLKSQYVVFDKTQSTPRLGFAAKST